MLKATKGCFHAPSVSMVHLCTSRSPPGETKSLLPLACSFKLLIVHAAHGRLYFRTSRECYKQLAMSSNSSRRLRPKLMRLPLTTSEAFFECKATGRSLGSCEGCVYQIIRDRMPCRARQLSANLSAKTATAAQHSRQDRTQRRVSQLGSTMQWRRQGRICRL